MDEGKPRTFRLLTDDEVIAADAMIVPAFEEGVNFEVQCICGRSLEDDDLQAFTISLVCPNCRRTYRLRIEVQEPDA